MATPILDKLKENVLITVVSLLFTGALIFVGSSFLSLQSTVSDQSADIITLEAQLKTMSESVALINAKLDIAIQNQTSVDFMKEMLRTLEHRVERLESR
jgi:hypothetical protein